MIRGTRSPFVAVYVGPGLRGALRLAMGVGLHLPAEAMGCSLQSGHAADAYRFATIGTALGLY
jgi:hypothetical protein